MLKKFCWDKRNGTNVFQLCCGQRDYVGYVGRKTLFENYVEMVAGLPRNKQNKIDQDLLRLINRVF